MNAPLVQAHIKSLRFDPQSPPILRNIDLTVTSGEFILLLGRSDAGKSVLGRCLSGVIPVFEKASLDGTVYLSGQKTVKTRLADLAPLVSLITDDPQDRKSVV
jgi:energy-coupling factor transport system ATP-binding protein